MMEQAEPWAPPLHGHLERLDREMAIVDRADRPADDESGIEI
jgi:hypothetical protein